MARVISTIMYNGQFWIALVEKYEDDGTLLVAKYTFGPEPTNTDLIDFYLNKYHLLQFHICDSRHRIKKEFSHKESERNTKKSFQVFSEEQKKFLRMKQKERQIKKNIEQKEKYQLKSKKRKEKKRGH
ncbi:MAG: DUF2992 family protein [Spirochaetales bacterium]|nr:DUF2992 family protein [Spirochaetales bacterium]